MLRASAEPAHIRYTFFRVEDRHPCLCGFGIFTITMIEFLQAHFLHETMTGLYFPSGLLIRGLYGDSPRRYAWFKGAADSTGQTRMRSLHWVCRAAPGGCFHCVFAFFRLICFYFSYMFCVQSVLTSRMDLQSLPPVTGGLC